MDAYERFEVWVSQSSNLQQNYCLNPNMPHAEGCFTFGWFTTIKENVG